MVDFVAETVAEEEIEAPYDAADPEQVQKARKKSGRKKTIRLDFIRSMMSTPVGRAYIREELQRSHVFSTSFVQGDPYATAFREGERNRGLRLLADITQAAPDLYMTMMKEAKYEG